MGYGTIAGWRTYSLERGNSAPTDATDALAGAALVRAQDYIKYNYVAYFYKAYNEDLEVVEFAVYEAANYELATPGFFSTTYTPSEQSVLVEVDGIKWKPIDNSSGSEDFMGASPVSNKIEAMLRRYMPSKNGIGIFSLGPTQ